MYKKITKIKKVTKKYASPYDTEVESTDDGDGEVETKVYGDTITMDIPFFVKLLEHVRTRITNSSELQALAESVVNASKTTPCLTSEEYDKVF